MISRADSMIVSRIRLEMKEAGLEVLTWNSSSAWFWFCPVYGADVVASKDDISYVFQCKYYSGPVGIDSVQEIFMAKQYYRADVAIVITNSVFTIAAIEAAKETRVKLYDGEKLEALRKRAFGS